jgi:hypothetical protein
MFGEIICSTAKGVRYSGRNICGNQMLKCSGTISRNMCSVL